jgi:hypothetical protein
MLMSACPTYGVIPGPSGVTEHVRKHELSDPRFNAEQRCRTARDGVASKLAVVPIVDATEPPLRSPAQLGRFEEFVALGTIASQPPSGVPVTCLEGPSEILDLDELPRKHCCRVRSPIGEEVNARRDELRSNTHDHRDADGLVGSVPPGRATLDAIGADDVAGDMKLIADDAEHVGRRSS